MWARFCLPRGMAQHCHHGGAWGPYRMANCTAIAAPHLQPTLLLVMLMVRMRFTPSHPAWLNLMHKACPT